MKIHKVSIPKKYLLSLPEKERLFLVYVGTLLNEINILHKMIFLSNREKKSDIETRAQNCQTSFLLAILTGKLWEAWILITNLYLKGTLSREYESHLPDEAKESLENLKKYFGSKGRWFKDIRDKIAFHYDLKTSALLDLIKNAKEEENFDMYLSEYQGNCLYFSSSAYIHLTALNLGGDFDDIWKALDKYFSEVADVTSWFLNFLNYCLVGIASKNNWTRDLVSEIEIADPQEAYEFSIPYFLKKPRSK